MTKEDSNPTLIQLNEDYSYDDVLNGARLYLKLDPATSETEVYAAGYRKYHASPDAEPTLIEKDAAAARAHPDKTPIYVFRWSLFHYYGV